MTLFLIFILTEIGLLGFFCTAVAAVVVLHSIMDGEEAMARIWWRLMLIGVAVGSLGIIAAKALAIGGGS